MSTKKHRGPLDPHREREAARYENPVASRELILETLAAAGVPLTDAELAQRLAITPSEREGFERRLAAMEREAQIVRNRKGAILVAQKLHLVAGRVEGHPEGYGFVVPDEGEDLYLPPHEMKKVLHGDRVAVRGSGVDHRGRTEAKVVEVIERVNSRVVGRLRREHGILFVEPSERRISQNIHVAAEDAGGARAGQVVVAELTAQPDGRAEPVGRIVEVLGEAADPGIEIEIALRKHNLPFKFSTAAEQLAAKYPEAPGGGDLGGREDLRKLELVTIDGETARDFDDAVYCEKTKEGFRLIVAIADVSHYVRDGDALDKEARERGNSVYFPRRVIPMLPERLSNGLCSLNPDVERLCMACDMAIGPQGQIGKYRFYPAVMRSRARLTYTSVAAALANPQGEAARALKALLPRLQLLDQLFRALLKAREERGAIDFETIETQFIFDKDNRLLRIDRVERNDAHRIIEECMLAANVCSSDFLSSREHPALYRVHEGPTPVKLKALREFLKGFGLQLAGGDKPTAKHYAKLLETVRKRPDVQLLQTVLLRSLQQAQYSPENVGHFGLAYEHYTHFTSPIRRYPDLLIHRSIKAVLAGGRYKPGNWSELGAHCSQTERRADEATREVASWLKCYYMRDRVGEEFEGSVSAVTGFGIFVALDDFYVEGLVHISELGQDYFQFDAVRHQLVGDRTRKTFRLADRVRVRIARVDLETSRLDFLLAGDSAEGQRHVRTLRRRSRTR
ncbi:MAG TPA: ribonuclease R [Burkholderiales bacterium]|nr:ribonuclease R [Burkholderiales bacterium]